jgi:hypothetical protein
VTVVRDTTIEATGITVTTTVVMVAEVEVATMKAVEGDMKIEGTMTAGAEEGTMTGGTEWVVFKNSDFSARTW